MREQREFQDRSSHDKGLGVLAGIVVAMLAIGGAGGYFGSKALDGSSGDDAATSAAASDAATAAPTSAAPDPNAWAVAGGFQVSMPAGWKAGGDNSAPGVADLVARPNGPDADQFEAGTLFVTFDRRPDQTPAKGIDDSFPEKCTPGEAKPWTRRGSSGLIKTGSACPNGFDYVRVAVTLPGGALLVVSSTQKGLDEGVVNEAIDSFKPTADASTQVAPQRGCGPFDPSTDPEYPLLLIVRNHLATQFSFGFLNDRGEIKNPTDVPPQYRTGTYFVKEGDVFRITKADGTTLDYTATAAPTQCLFLEETGLVPGP